MVSVIMAKLAVDFPTAKDLIDQYTESRARHSKEGTENARKRVNTVCEYPSGTCELNERTRAYLSSRGFDADILERMWGIKSTTHCSPYKFRCMVGIFLDGKMVSYQGRDITGRSALKYKACKQADEVIEHQTIAFGLDHAKGDSCIVVEGIFDVFRLGYGAISLFGISFTVAQVNLLASRFRKVFILFDAEEQAQKQAQELGCMLSAQGVEVEILELEEGDPAEMSQEEADKLMKELFG
jgi:nucleotide-binding universal stress UspA family protein